MRARRLLGNQAYSTGERRGGHMATAGRRSAPGRVRGGGAATTGSARARRRDAPSNEPRATSPLVTPEQPCRFRARNRPGRSPTTVELAHHPRR